MPVLAPTRVRYHWTVDPTPSPSTLSAAHWTTFVQAVAALNTAVLQYLPEHFTPIQLQYVGARPLQTVLRTAVANVLSNDATLPAVLSMEPSAINVLRYVDRDSKALTAWV